MAFPDAWEENALVEVSLFHATTPLKWQFATMTETIDIAEPDYPGESIPNLAGGRVWKQSPQEDGEITLEVYPIELDATDDVASLGLFQQYNGGTYDATATIRETDTAWGAGIDRTRDRFRVCILWTNDPAATTASGVTAAATDSLRFVALSCRMTSHKSDFTDGILKTTVTFKFPAFNQAGTVRQYAWQSGDASALTTAQLVEAYDDVDSYV